MNKEGLVKIFKAAIDGGYDHVAIFVSIPGNKKPEVIINRREDFLNKLIYYRANYDEELIHKHAPDVRILMASYGSTEVCLEMADHVR